MIVNGSDGHIFPAKLSSPPKNYKGCRRPGFANRTFAGCHAKEKGDVSAGKTHHAGTRRVIPPAEQK